MRSKGVVASVAFVLFVVFRAGFRPTDGLQGYVDVSRGFPDSVSGFMRTSPLHPMFGSVLNLETRTSWMVVYILFILIALFVVRAQMQSITNHSNQVMMLLLLGPIGTSFFIQIGHYDTLLIIGSLIMVTSRVWYVQFAAAMLMVGANIELASVSLLMLLVVSTVISTPLSTRRTLALGVSSVAIWYTISLRLFGDEAISDGRASFFVDQLKSSLILNVRNVPLLAFSFFGICWVPLLLIARRCESRQKLLVLVTGLVLVPTAFTLLTLDGTRVFTSLSAASLTSVLASSSDRLAVEHGKWYRTTAILLAAVLIPSVWVYMGDIRAPHGYLYELIYDR